MIAALAAAALVVQTCWAPPVAVAPDEPFRAPACSYCPGHRGVGYTVAPLTTVTAVAGGVVDFAGQVAGVRWVVVSHDQGLRSSYGHLSSVLVARGQRVQAGQPLGLSSDRLHLGVRKGDRYLDPALLLGRWETRPRLVPSDGSPARPPPRPRLVCPVVDQPSPAAGLRK